MKLQPYQDFFQSGIIQIFAAFLVFCGIFWLTTLSWSKPINIVDSIGIKNPTVASAEPLEAVSYQNLDTLSFSFYHAPDSPNLFDGGNCTYYVKERRPDIPNEFGNANTWDDVAQQMGYTVSDTPMVGAVGVSNGGYYGHVVYVEEISGDQVFVSEMNVHGLWVTDRAWYPINQFVYIY